MGTSAGNDSTASAAASLEFGELLKQKPAVLIANWKEEFSSLRSVAKIQDPLDSALQIEVQDEPLLPNGWTMCDKATGFRYVIGKSARTKTLDQIVNYLFRNVNQLLCAVSLNLPAEGPLGDRGIESFDDFAFWPLATSDTRTYVGSIEGEQQTLLLSVKDIATIDDESIITKIKILGPLATEEKSLGKCASDAGESMPNRVICHIQQINWPPDGYPPNCTFSVLRIAHLVLDECKRSKSPQPLVFITCSNGAERSAALAILCCCISRLGELSAVSKVNQLLYEMVVAIRRRHAQVMQCRGTYLWLQYAVLEFCSTFIQKEKGKEKSPVRNWLTKLRKAVYEAAIANE